MSNSISRKDFLKKVASVGAALSVAGVALQGCGESDPCTDVSGLMPADFQARKSFNYVEKTADATKNCANCQLYKAPEGGAKCGGCLLFKGNVTANGYCTSWAQKISG
jgi:hypothetical protein